VVFSQQSTNIYRHVCDPTSIASLGPPKWNKLITFSRWMHYSPHLRRRFLCEGLYNAPHWMIESSWAHRFAHDLSQDWSFVCMYILHLSLWWARSRTYALIDCVLRSSYIQHCCLIIRPPFLALFVITFTFQCENLVQTFGSGPRRTFFPLASACEAMNRTVMPIRLLLL
jgi:hypothetical protein